MVEYRFVGVIVGDEEVAFVAGDELWAVNVARWVCVDGVRFVFADDEQCPRLTPSAAAVWMPFLR